MDRTRPHAHETTDNDECKREQLLNEKLSEKVVVLTEVERRLQSELLVLLYVWIYENGKSLQLSNKKSA